MAKNTMKSKVTDRRSKFNKQLKREAQAHTAEQLMRAATRGGEQRSDPTPRAAFTPTPIPQPLYAEGERIDVTPERYAVVSRRFWNGAHWIYTLMRSWGVNRTYKENELPDALLAADFIQQVMPANSVSLSKPEAPEGAEVAHTVHPGDTILQWSFAHERWLSNVVALTTTDEYGRACCAFADGVDNKAGWFILHITPDMYRREGVVDTYPAAWEQLALCPTPDQLFDARVAAQLAANTWMRRLDAALDQVDMDDAPREERDYAYIGGRNVVPDVR